MAFDAVLGTEAQQAKRGFRPAISGGLGGLGDHEPPTRPQ